MSIFTIEAIEDGVLVDGMLELIHTHENFYLLRTVKLEMVVAVLPGGGMLAGQPGPRQNRPSRPQKSPGLGRPRQGLPRPAPPATRAPKRPRR